METLVIFVRYEVWLLLGAFSFIVGYQLLTGKINTHGLLLGKHARNRFSPARVQLLVFTLAGVASCLTQLLNHPTKLPEMPQELMVVVGEGNLFYVGSKARSWLFPRNEPQNHEGGRTWPCNT
jgi:hypothetical protein